MELLKIGTKREVFWDDYLADAEKTTAKCSVCHLEEKEICFIFEQEQWIEHTSFSYPCVVKDDRGYRLYYSPWSFGKKEPYVSICVIESLDGIHWKRPHLDIYPHPEIVENNIVLDHIMDSAFIFYDTNPACPAEEKYKAVGQARGTYNGEENVFGLWCWTSPDGYHFTLSHMLTNQGRFDSLNTVFWKEGKYYCYMRDFHNIIPGGEISDATRDVRVMTSTDMIHWTTPKMLEFNDKYDIPLYTNNVVPYDRADHVFVGFPVRYCERKSMTENVEQFPSLPIKLNASKCCEYPVDIKRMALVTTDCIFMCSRDGEKWYRYNEAFMTGGMETPENWVYGDCYLAYHWLDAGDDKLYLYDFDRHFVFDEPKRLRRYEIRKDGFACYMAGGEEAVLVTKPLEFSGKDLHLNFETSAYGYIYVDVLDEAGNPISGESFEIYGNTIDRKISFADGTDFSAFANKPVRLRFRMRDAKLYSMKFE